MKKISDDELKEESIQSQHRGDALKLAALALQKQQASGRMAESSTQIMDKVLESSYLYGKELKTGNMGGNKPSLDINFLRISYCYQLEHYNFPITEKAYLRDVLAEFSASNSKGALFNKLLMGLKLFIGMDNEKDDESTGILGRRR